PTTVNVAPVIDLSIAKTHTGNFTVGEIGRATCRERNVGNTPTTGAITESDTLPTGLGFVSGTGTGWTCGAALQVVTCTNNGPLAANAPTSITLTVSVAAAAVPSVINAATGSSTGDSNGANTSSSDPTTVNVAPVIDLSIAKTHTGNFTVG